jgi:hypothetical protein
MAEELPVLSRRAVVTGAGIIAGKSWFLRTEKGAGENACSNKDTSHVE